MKFSYYPGCTLKTKAKELDAYGRRAAQALGVEFEEIENWQCCGAVYPQAEDEIAARLSSVRALDAARQKNQELLACTKHIGETDQKIQQVRMKFMPQFQPIEEKTKALSGEVKSIETMRAQYSTAESRVAMVKKQMDDSRKEKKEIVDTRKDELDVISCLASALKKYNQTIVENYQDLMTKQANVSAVLYER